MSDNGLISLFQEITWRKDTLFLLSKSALKVNSFDSICISFTCADVE